MPRHLLIAAIALAACGPQVAAPPPPPTPQFIAEPAATTPGLTISIDPQTQLAEVWAKELGPVFGVSFHFTISGDQLGIDSVTLSDAFGPDAKRLQRITDRDASLALVLPDPRRAPVDLTPPTRLATVTLSRKTPVNSRPSLDRVSIRRVDGAFVPASITSGTLVLP